MTGDSVSGSEYFGRNPGGDARIHCLTDVGERARQPPERIQSRPYQQDPAGVGDVLATQCVTEDAAVW